MTATGEPERKKRTAERQITKDDPQEEDGNHEEETSTKEPCQDFPKADPETMKKRRTVKATFKPSLNQEKEEEETKNNPFASLAQKTGSVFGSGFSGGFGTAATNNNGGGFRFGSSNNGGFGSAAAGSGFQVAASQGANSSTASLFGSAFSGTAASTTSSLSESAFGSTTSAKATSLTETQFPEHVDLKTGEEDEEVVFQVRSKAFVLVEKEELKPMPTEVEDGAIHSVPPSSSNANAAAKEDAKESATEETNAEQVNEEKSKESKGEDSSDKKKEPEASEETKVEDDSDKKKEPEASDKEDQKTETQENGKPKEAPESKKKKDWQELGTGPLRILRRKDGSHTRVVQRRETMEGGAGTKLLINVPLSKESTVARPSEKHVRLSTIEPSGTAATYLLKVKTKDEANALEKALEGEIGQAESLVET